jgi:hypothetical protein
MKTGKTTSIPSTKEQAGFWKSNYGKLFTRASIIKISALLALLTVMILVGCIIMFYLDGYRNFIRILFLEGIFGVEAAELHTVLLYLIFFCPFVVFFLFNWIFSYWYLKFLVFRYLERASK